MSLLQRDSADFLADGRLLLPPGQRAARRNASRDSRIGGEKAEKPTVRPTFNRAGLACYERIRMSRIARVGGEERRKKERKGEGWREGRTARGNETRTTASRRSGNGRIWPVAS